MPELQMSGDIGFEELSPQLQALITSGAGSGGSFVGNVTLKTEVLSVVATEERQKEFTIPKSGYIQSTHNFELRIGSVWIHPDRYQIQGNKIVFNEDEVGIAQGRRLDFVFCYLVKDDGTEVPLDGANLKDGSVTKAKLSTELQSQIDSVNSVKQSVTELSTKLDSSVKDVETSNNFNSIRIIKNDGTTTDVPIKILGGTSGSTLNVFKTAELGGSFTATTETNSFVITELEESMDVNLIFKNLFLVKDTDFTVNKESKTVVLNFNLEANETIYYILTGTSFKYDDLDGAPNVGDTNSLATTSKEVVGAINELNKRVITNLSDIGCSTESTLLEMCSSVPRFSVLNVAFESKISKGFPLDRGCMLIITRSDNQADVEYIPHPYSISDVRKYYCEYTPWTSEPLTNWREIATTDHTNLIYGRTLAPVLGNVIPDALYIGDEWTGIYCVRTDYGTVNAPPNCIIGVRTMKKLNDDNVVVNVENTQNGEKWTNTWNGSTWLGWQQIITSDIASGKLDKIITMPHNQDLNQNLEFGVYHFFNSASGFPNGYISGDNDFILQVTSSGVTNVLWQTQLLTDIRSGKIFKRAKISGTYGEWQEMSTTTKLNINTANGFYSAWTTEYSNVLNVEIVGDIVHVRAILEVQNSVQDVKINESALPSPAKDWWVSCHCFDYANSFNVYMGWDGFLYCKASGFSGIFQVDFTYRKG